MNNNHMPTIIEIRKMKNGIIIKARGFGSWRPTRNKLERKPIGNQNLLKFVSLTKGPLHDTMKIWVLDIWR